MTVRRNHCGFPVRDRKKEGSELDLTYLYEYLDFGCFSRRNSFAVCDRCTDTDGEPLNMVPKIIWRFK